jgi:hypothetical protein
MPPAGGSGSGMGRGSHASTGPKWLSMGCHPVCRRPRQSRAALPPGVQVVRTVARSTWTPGGKPAPLTCGSTADGMAAAKAVVPADGSGPRTLSSCTGWPVPSGRLINWPDSVHQLVMWVTSWPERVAKSLPTAHNFLKCHMHLICSKYEYCPDLFSHPLKASSHADNLNEILHEVRRRQGSGVHNWGV